MIEFNLNKTFREKEERKEHLREKIGKKIAYNKEQGNEYSFFSVAKRAIQEVMPADKFEAYATISKTIEEKYGFKLTLGKDGNTDISTNKYGQHSWYIRFKEDSEEEKNEKAELISQIQKLELIEKSFNNATIEVFAPVNELCKIFENNYRISGKYYSHLYVPGYSGSIHNMGDLKQLLLEVSNKIQESKIKNNFGTPYERWNSFYIYLEKYLKELIEVKLKIETSENYIKYEKEYGEINISESENKKDGLVLELESLNSVPNTISIKDHFAVGQGDIEFTDNTNEYHHYYQYKDRKNNYIDKTIILNFDDKNKINDILLCFMNKAYNDGVIMLENSEYIKEFKTLEECTNYLKNID